jgi:hypothetical protein
MPFSTLKQQDGPAYGGLKKQQRDIIQIDEVHLDGHVKTDELQEKTTSASVTATHGLIIPDGQFLKLGNSNDLLAFHDGSNSFFRDNGTGILQLGTNGTSIDVVDNANSKTIAQFKTGASDSRAEFYYNNLLKLATTSNGVTVSGSMILTAIPTSDPGIVGALYRDASGHVKIST